MSAEPGELRPIPRSRIDARTTAWLIEQRTRAREKELEVARLQGELNASERIERSAQRYADRLEDKLADARKREASLARALGYIESQRDQLLAQLGLPPAPRGELSALMELPEGARETAPSRRRV